MIKRVVSSERGMNPFPINPRKENGWVRHRTSDPPFPNLVHYQRSYRGFTLKIYVATYDKFERKDNELKFSDRVENIVGKGENDGYRHILFSSHCFPKLSSSGLLNKESFYTELKRLIF